MSVSKIHRIDEGILRGIVKESVRRVLREYHGSLYDTYSSLAEYILKVCLEGCRRNGGRYDVSMGQATFSKYGCSVPNGRPIMIKSTTAVNRGSNGIVRGHFDLGSNTLTLNIYPDSNGGYNHTIEAIIHELTHGVNGRDVNLKSSMDIGNKMIDSMDNSEFSKIWNSVLYLFFPTEIQARLSQFPAELNDLNGWLMSGLLKRIMEEGSSYMENGLTGLRRFIAGKMVYRSQSLQYGRMVSSVESLKKMDFNYGLYKKACEEGNGSLEPLYFLSTSEGRKAFPFHMNLKKYPIVDERSYQRALNVLYNELGRMMEEYKYKGYTLANDFLSRVDLNGTLQNGRWTFME